MTDDRKTGIALLAGSLGGILTMVVHPHGAASMSADQIAHLAVVSGAAHSLGMVSFVLTFLGACGLLRRIADIDRLAFAGTVIYGFASAAILIATAVSGFIVPNIMQHMARDIPAAAREWEIVTEGIFQINQAFARIYSVAASLSILLWSVAALRNGSIGRAIAVYGCVIAPVIILGIALGRLRLDVHGMGVIVLGHAIWLIVVGVQLCRGLSSPRA